MKMYRMQIETTVVRELTVECDTAEDAAMIGLGYQDSDNDMSWSDVSNNDNIISMEEINQQITEVPEADYQVTISDEDL